MKAKFLASKESYDGRQLGSLWAYREHDVQGDSILAWIGPCDVKTGELVDLEDAKAGDHIFAPQMLHFIAEHFDLDLEAAILRQYLLVGLAQDELNRPRHRVLRRGNDLHAGAGKLSVSIATLTPVSSKIHFAINIDAKGAPVKTADLRQLKASPLKLARAVLKRYADDFNRMQGARSKVRGVA